MRDQSRAAFFFRPSSYICPLPGATPRSRPMGKANPKPEFPGCDCAARSHPGQAGYSLRHMIAALERMSAWPEVSDFKQHENDRHGVGQVPDQTTPHHSPKKTIVRRLLTSLVYELGVTQPSR